VRLSLEDDAIRAGQPSPSKVIRKNIALKKAFQISQTSSTNRISDLN